MQQAERREQYTRGHRDRQGVADERLVQVLDSDSEWPVPDGAVSIGGRSSNPAEHDLSYVE